MHILRIKGYDESKKITCSAKIIISPSGIRIIELVTKKNITISPYQNYVTIIKNEFEPQIANKLIGKISKYQVPRVYQNSHDPYKAKDSSYYKNIIAENLESR